MAETEPLIFSDEDIILEEVESIDTTCKKYGITLTIAASETDTEVFLSKDELYNAFLKVSQKETQDTLIALQNTEL